MARKKARQGVQTIALAGGVIAGRTALEYLRKEDRSPTATGSGKMPKEEIGEYALSAGMLAQMSKWSPELSAFLVGVGCAGFSGVADRHVTKKIVKPTNGGMA